MRLLISPLFRFSRHLILLFVFVVVVPAQAMRLTGAQDSLRFQRLPVKKGDLCIVCGAAVDGRGTVLLYKGRRVPVANDAMLKEFLRRPEFYFSKQQPQGALFQESAVMQRALRWGWFALGAWVLAALVAAALSASLALRRGLPASRWFIIGLACSFFGLILLLRRPAVERVELPGRLAKIPATAAPVRCPGCGAETHPAAAKCAGCGGKLSPARASEVERAGLRSS